jgi:hypothetical protein
VSIGDTVDDNDLTSGSCVRSDWEVDNIHRCHHYRALDKDASVMGVAERAACGSCCLAASDMTEAGVCDGECLDGREVADLPSRDKPVLDCNSSMDIRKGCGECCWLEALLRCRDRCLTPAKTMKS